MSAAKGARHPLHAVVHPFPTTCLQPDAMDSACKCCQRWFYALEQRGHSQVSKQDEPDNSFTKTWGGLHGGE